MSRFQDTRSASTDRSHSTAPIGYSINSAGFISFSAGYLSRMAPNRAPQPSRHTLRSSAASAPRKLRSTGPVHSPPKDAAPIAPLSRRKSSKAPTKAHAGPAHRTNHGEDQDDSGDGRESLTGDTGPLAVSEEVSETPVSSSLPSTSSHSHYGSPQASAAPLAPEEGSDARSERETTEGMYPHWAGSVTHPSRQSLTLLRNREHLEATTKRLQRPLKLGARNKQRRGFSPQTRRRRMTRWTETSRSSSQSLRILMMGGVIGWRRTKERIRLEIRSTMTAMMPNASQLAVRVRVTMPTSVMTLTVFLTTTTTTGAMTPAIGSA